ncbi:tail fiber assembly protein [Pseudomonas putida]|uniref:Tail fiber assembly protein n=1 Tax=Pseudomonas putida TaxID=303 RepID=A0A6I6XLP4_PSEPU|nr:tail fiber assembly protein [Pseudomonas putida]QHG66588.1 tail fiber assembly protein [Pseudomonas putida]
MDAPTIYHADPFNWQFCGTGTADPDPVVLGNWLVPARAYLDAPPQAEKGYAVVRNGDQSAWELVEDHRGELFSTVTGEPLLFLQLGPLPVGLAHEPRPGPYHHWDGQAWVLDSAAQQLGLRQEALIQRDERLVLASMRIAPLQDAIDLDRATESELSQLQAWKTYRIELGRIEQQTGFPTDVEWPPSPEDDHLLP